MSKFCKLAKEWLDAANSDQNAVVKLKQQLEAETKKRESLEHKIELLMQRVEANEGTDLRGSRRAMVDPVEDELVEEGSQDDVEEPAKRRGRPRKV